MDEFTQDNIDRDYADELRRRGALDYTDELRRHGAPLIADRLDRANAGEPYCGAYWIITTCLTGIAIGIWLGMVLWLMLGEHR